MTRSLSRNQQWSVPLVVSLSLMQKMMRLMMSKRLRGMACRNRKIATAPNADVLIPRIPLRHCAILKQPSTWVANAPRHPTSMISPRNAFWWPLQCTDVLSVQPTRSQIISRRVTLDDRHGRLLGTILTVSFRWVPGSLNWYVLDQFYRFIYFWCLTDHQSRIAPSRRAQDQGPTNCRDILWLWKRHQQEDD